jgi:ubiquinone/menaquinone biosynthesis C-methylase UbiE
METLNRELDSEKIKSAYKNVVWFYDFWSWLTESKAAKKVIEFSAIKSGEHILEVACGTGVVFEKVVSKNPNGKNIGIDLSPEMLKKANARLSKLKNTSYELKEGDALNLNFQDNFFDLVINNFMVDLMPVGVFDKVACEFYRVIKPGGILVVSTFSFGKKKVNKIWQWVAKRFPDLLTGCRPVSFKKYLLDAGFEIERSIEISQNTFPSEIIKAIKIA